MAMVRRLSAVGVALVALSGLAGCTAGSTDSGSPTPRSSLTKEYIDRVGYEAEYSAAATTLNLPPGAQWPRLPESVFSPIPLPDGKPGEQIWTTGSGTVRAENEWFCAWAREWMAQRGKDEQRAKAALAEMLKVKQTKYYSRHTEEARQIRDSALASAQLDDPAPVQTWVNGACLQ
jgi:hypothetical protein